MSDKIKDRILKILSRIEDVNQKLRKNDMEFIMSYSKKYKSVDINLKKSMNKRYITINDLCKDFGFSLDDNLERLNNQKPN